MKRWSKKVGKDQDLQLLYLSSPPLHPELCNSQKQQPKKHIKKSSLIQASCYTFSPWSTHYYNRESVKSRRLVILSLLPRNVRWCKPEQTTKKKRMILSRNTHTKQQTPLPQNLWITATTSVRWVKVKNPAEPQLVTMSCRLLNYAFRNLDKLS